MTDRSYKVCTAIIAIATLTPLMLVHSEMWDMILAEMAYKTGDFSLIRDWLIEQGWYMKYYTYVVTDTLNAWTGLPHKFFTNSVTVISILGISREMFRLLTDTYEFDKKVAYVGAWSILAFPVWHTLISSAVFINILCLWLFMIAIRLWRTNKILALIFLIPSLQLFSLFAFAVGFIVSDFLLTADGNNFKKKISTSVLLSFALLVAYIILMSFINIHGTTGKNYNSFNLDRIKSFINYGIMTVVILLSTYGLTKTIDNKTESERLIRHVLSFLALAFFAGLAYWAVGRPMRFFAFGSFTARHTYLTCIPFALLISIIAEYMFKRINHKAYWGIVSFTILALIVLLHQGYSHKIAAVIFKDMATHAFAKTEAPPSGYVAIFPQGYKPPRHVHGYAMNVCLYKAYGRSAWMTNGYWLRDSDLSRSSLEQQYQGGSSESARHQLALDVTGDTYTKYTFTLSDYHQEGRFWYWIYHILGYYNTFKPKLELR